MHIKQMLFVATAIAAYTIPGQVLAQSDPPAKPAPDSIQQPSPQGHPGQLKTDESKGSKPTNPQGGTPNSMQVKPQGEDRSDNTDKGSTKSLK